MEKIPAAVMVKDVSLHEFVKAYAAHLKCFGKMKLPHWTDIVKTGTFKELALYNLDWYYIRAGKSISGAVLVLELSGGSTEAAREMVVAHLISARAVALLQDISFNNCRA